MPCRRAARLLLLTVAVAVAYAGTACIRDFGTGGTGELVVPRARLRQVEAIDLGAFSQAVPVDRPPPPTTLAAQPGTGPSTAPVAATASTTGRAPTTRAAAANPDALLARPASRPAAGPPPAEMPLTLVDVRRLALENNLDLRVELLNPSIARQGLTEAEAQFEALFTSNLSFGKSDSPVASQLAGSQTTDVRADVGLDVPLRTGGTLRLALPVDRFETNNAFTFLNPAYTAGPAVSISQPLLRGGGFDVNAQRIRVAFYALQQAEARTKLEVIRVLADAERVYWRLFAAREELRLRQQQYDLAYAQLERARRQARAGVVPEVDVVRAESGVADRVEGIILSENAARDRQRELKRILNIPGLPMESRTILVPATDPPAIAYRLDGPALAAAALGSRMEMLETELQVAEETANVRAARNDTLPLVTLEYTYSVNGLGPAIDDALSQVREKRFEDHRLGLRVEVPVGNQAAESRLRRAILNRYQRLAGREQRAAQVRQEVLTATDQLDANWQRIIAARGRVVLAARVLDVETRQFNQGLRTSTDVLDAQTRLADARLSEISAVTEYQIAQVDIAFATGTVLGAGHVVWAPTVGPDGRGRD